MGPDSPLYYFWKPLLDDQELKGRQAGRQHYETDGILLSLRGAHNENRNTLLVLSAFIPV